MPTKRVTRKIAKPVLENIKSAALSSTSKLSLKDRIKRPKFFIPLIIIILIAAAFYWKGLFIAALINGQPITRLSVVQQLEKQGGKQTLSSLVNQTLILQEARKKNVTVDQKEIDDSIKQIEDSLKSQGQSLDTALTMQGMTRQDLAEQLKVRNLVEKLLADKTKVTDEEVAGYISKNIDNFPTDMKEDEIKKSVTEQLKQQKLATESQTWLDELTKNAKINYFVNY